jgi:hypothetical protein
MESIEKLDSLLAVLRRHGVQQFRDGPFEVHFSSAGSIAMPVPTTVQLPEYKLVTFEDEV